MSDIVQLEVNGKRISHFLSYTIEADLYVADHAFSLEIADPDFVIKPGLPCKLFVNGKLELIGIIDRCLKRCDKQGWRMTIEGRDLMGLLVDSFCEDWVTVKGMTLGKLAQFLIGPNPKTGRPAIPFISRSAISGQMDLVGRIKTRRSNEASFGLDALFGDGSERIAQIRPGMTIFQVLQMYALSAGVMFFCLPDGTFQFNRPRVGGDPAFAFVFRRSGDGNNALASEVEENIAKRYSKVIVVGQRQAEAADGMDVTRTNVSDFVTDPSFPFYKPFVQLSHNDSQTPKQHARLLLEKMRHDGTRLSYDLPRHSQNGTNFTVNQLARVMDEVNLLDGKPIDGIYLVSGRTFKLDKTAGPTTTVRLSPPGLIEDGGKNGGGRG